MSCGSATAQKTLGDELPAGPWGCDLKASGLGVVRNCLLLHGNSDTLGCRISLL